MPVYLGLDCGGSSSRALALDESATVVFQGQGGPANIASTPPRKFRFSLENAVQGCRGADYVCGCFAGLLTSEDRLHAEQHLNDLFPNAQIRATPDYAAALYASDEGTDLVVIAGTGSLICSRGTDGIVKSGGRGYILGDHGSAFQYGRAALVQFLNKRSDCSVGLVSAIDKLFGTQDEARILSRVYRQGSPPATLARLAKPLAHDAAAGHQYARREISDQSAALAKITAGHMREQFVGRDRLGICLAGGLWQTAGIFREAFMGALKEEMEGVELVDQKIKHPPVMGAVRLAREMADGN